MPFCTIDLFVSPLRGPEPLASGLDVCTTPALESFILVTEPLLVGIHHFDRPQQLTFPEMDFEGRSSSQKET